MVDYQEGKQTHKPIYSIELNGKIFKHKLGTTSFCNINDENETIGFYKLLKLLSPETYRSKSMRYKAPEGLLLLGAASRLRVMRAVQLHYYEPIVTPYVFNTIEPLLRYMSDDNTDCGEFNKVKQQFDACRWAAWQKYGNDYASKIYLFATSLFNNVGIAPNFNELKMKGSSSHVITPTQDGIIIEITDRYPICERFHKGLLEIEKGLNWWKRRGVPKPLKSVLGNAMRAFYVCGDFRLSINNQLRVEIYNAYKSYYLNSNSFGIGSIKEPTFDNPLDMLEPQTVFLPYGDFIKDGVSDKQLEQRQRNAYNMCYEATMQKAAKLPETRNLFTTQQLRNVGLYSSSLANAQKYGIIEWLDWGKYRFASDFWQEVCCNTPDNL